MDCQLPFFNNSHELTSHHWQLVLRPQDIEFDLSVWLYLHPPYQTGYHIQAVFFLNLLFFVFLFLFFAHTLAACNRAGLGLLSASVMLSLRLSQAIVYPSSRKQKQYSFILGEKERDGFRYRRQDDFRSLWRQPVQWAQLFDQLSDAIFIHPVKLQLNIYLCSPEHQSVHNTFLWALNGKSQFESYLNGLLLLNTTMLGHDWPKLWKNRTLLTVFFFTEILLIQSAEVTYRNMDVPGKERHSHSAYKSSAFHFDIRSKSSICFLELHFHFTITLEFLHFFSNKLGRCTLCA